MARNAFYASKYWKDLRREALERDRHRCVVPGCRSAEGASRLHVDHVATRPNVDYPTPQDVLSNLRTLCADHDRQVKEARGGRRRRDGKLSAKGCDASGRPVDPGHHWTAR